jgi:hypothetical protein
MFRGEEEAEGRPGKEAVPAIGGTEDVTDTVILVDRKQREGKEDNGRPADGTYWRGLSLSSANRRGAGTPGI